MEIRGYSSTGNELIFALDLDRTEAILLANCQSLHLSKGRDQYFRCSCSALTTSGEPSLVSCDAFARFEHKLHDSAHADKRKCNLTQFQPLDLVAVDRDDLSFCRMHQKNTVHEPTRKDTLTHTLSHTHSLTHIHTTSFCWNFPLSSAPNPCTISTTTNFS